MPVSDSPEKTSRFDDEHVREVQLLPAPEEMIRLLPVKGTRIESFVGASRAKARDIVHGVGDRLLVVIGPCSIHDPRSAKDYAKRLFEQRQQFADTLEIIMRVYFEKPRTTVGWKGLINDPGLDETYRIQDGLRIARELLFDINEIGVPAGSELLDTSSPQYISDLISWGAIGARTTESQIHRELASGASMPIGFKNGTSGNIRVAVDAILAASCPHSFLGVHKNGQIAVVRTDGNADCHVILRGGIEPNFDSKSVALTCASLESSRLRAAVMIDCSHANAGKRYERQTLVIEDIATQVASGSRNILGVMIESHLVEGSQRFVPGVSDPGALVYGQSITDACLGWSRSVEALAVLSRAVCQRRERSGDLDH